MLNRPSKRAIKETKKEYSKKKKLKNIKKSLATIYSFAL